MAVPSVGTTRAPGSRTTVGRLLTVSALVVIAAMTLLGALAYLQLRALAADRGPIERTYRVLAGIGELQHQLDSAETGQRGYLITGDEAYLAPYRGALPQIGQTMTGLARLMEGNPAQLEALDQLRLPVTDKLAELAETIELRRTVGAPAATALVRTNRGARDMQVIRRILAQMQGDEYQLLERRLSTSEAHAGRTRIGIATGTLVVCLVVCLGAVRLRRKVVLPVRQVTAGAHRVAEGHLDELQDVAGPREIAQMAEAINASVRIIAYARDRALSAAAARSAFLATVSHEIRTPMNAVIGMAELLLDTELDAIQREFAQTVHDSGDALLAIINDILDYSKIESGELELDEHPFGVRDCVEGALALVAVAARAKGLELVADVEEDVPTLLRGDAARLRQVLVNLLANAVKFTADGEVVVRVAAEALSGHANGRVRLRLEVSDTGIGIHAEGMRRLFQPFVQADSTTTRLYGGTGLGLAISRRLVRAMDGDISVRSEVGVGSVFTVTVVLTACPDGRRPDPSAGVALGGRSVLVVDDNATNRRVLRLQLESWAMTCVDVGSADEALSLLAGGARFDVAILDMHMPGLDGHQLGAAIRQMPAYSNLPLVLLSSLQRHPERPEAALFAAVLNKPLRSALLRQSLYGVLAPVEATLAAVERFGGNRATDPPADNLSALNILLVEDNRTNQKVAQLLLAKLGHRVDIVSDGLQAVQAVHLHDYDLVLMDVHMPVLDGLQATQRIRDELPTHRQPRIVAMTASVMLEDRAACRAAGMDDHLAKPIRRHELVAVLRAAGTAGTAPAPAPALPAAERPEPAPAPSSGSSGLEQAVRVRLAELGGDGTPEDALLLAQLLRSFLERAPALLAEVERAVARDDHDSLEEHAHSLKGAALNLGGATLGHACAELEAAGRSGHLAGADTALAQAHQELAALTVVLDELAAEFDPMSPSYAAAPSGPPDHRR